MTFPFPSPSPSFLLEGKSLFHPLSSTSSSSLSSLRLLKNKNKQHKNHPPKNQTDEYSHSIPQPPPPPVHRNGNGSVNGNNEKAKDVKISPKFNSNANIQNQNQNHSYHSTHPYSSSSSLSYSVSVDGVQTAESGSYSESESFIDENDSQSLSLYNPLDKLLIPPSPPSSSPSPLSFVSKLKSKMKSLNVWNPNSDPSNITMTMGQDNDNDNRNHQQNQKENGMNGMLNGMDSDHHGANDNGGDCGMGMDISSSSSSSSSWWHKELLLFPVDQIDPKFEFPLTSHSLDSFPFGDNQIKGQNQRDDIRHQNHHTETHNDTPLSITQTQMHISNHGDGDAKDIPAVSTQNPNGYSHSNNDKDNGHTDTQIPTPTPTPPPHLISHTIPSRHPHDDPHDDRHHNTNQTANPNALSFLNDSHQRLSPSHSSSDSQYVPIHSPSSPPLPLPIPSVSFCSLCSSPFLFDFSEIRFECPPCGVFLCFSCNFRLHSKGKTLNHHEKHIKTHGEKDGGKDREEYHKDIGLHNDGSVTFSVSSPSYSLPPPLLSPSLSLSPSSSSSSFLLSLSSLHSPLRLPSLPRVPSDSPHLCSLCGEDSLVFCPFCNLFLCGEKGSNCDEMVHTNKEKKHHNRNPIKEKQKNQGNILMHHGDDHHDHRDDDDEEDDDQHENSPHLIVGHQYQYQNMSNDPLSITSHGNQSHENDNDNDVMILLKHFDLQSNGTKSKNPNNTKESSASSSSSSSYSTDIQQFSVSPSIFPLTINQSKGQGQTQGQFIPLEKGNDINQHTNNVQIMNSLVREEDSDKRSVPATAVPDWDMERDRDRDTSISVFPPAPLSPNVFSLLNSLFSHVEKDIFLPFSVCIADKLDHLEKEIKEKQRKIQQIKQQIPLSFSSSSSSSPPPSFPIDILVQMKNQISQTKNDRNQLIFLQNHLSQQKINSVEMLMAIASPSSSPSIPLKLDFSNGLLHKFMKQNK